MGKHYIYCVCMILMISFVVSQVYEGMYEMYEGRNKFGEKQSAHSQLNAQSLLKQIDTFELKIMVDIILVGYDKNENYEISTSMLQTYFDRFTQAFSKEQELVHFKLKNELKETSIRRKIMYRVAKTVSTLNEQLEKAVSSAISASFENKGPSEKEQEVLQIPAQIVDNLVRADFQKLGVSYSLYILRSGIKHDYRYIMEGQEDEGGGCEFAGAIGEKRYVWIDLDAGPLEYGPVFRGHGGISAHSRFRPRDLVEGHGLHPSAESFGMAGEDPLAPLYPEIVAFAHRTIQQLIAPPLMKPPSMSQDIVLDLFHVCASKVSATCPGLQEDFDSLGDTLQAQLEAMQMIGQRVKVNVQFTHIADNALLASGISSALEVTDNSYILDSAELYYWLKKFFNAQDTDDDNKSSKHRHPVFVLELDTEESVLLDGLTPSKAFEDLVVAVYTQAEESPSGLFCQGRNPAPFYADQSLQYVLASILESVWGILPRQTTFNPLDHRLDTDYLWATGSGLHSPLSTSEKFFFPEHDSPRQGMLLLKFDLLIAELKSFFLQVMDVAPHRVTYLSPKEAILLERHWNLAWSDLDKASTHFSLHNFNYAWQLIDSSESAFKDFQKIYRQCLKASWKYLLGDGSVKISDVLGETSTAIPSVQMILSIVFCATGIIFCFLTVLKLQTNG